MSEQPIDDGLQGALRTVHDGLWDPEADLVRLAPGVNPGADLSSWNLHAVRETALGAVVDLRHGQVQRAVEGIRQVLTNQYLAEGVPWSGTFKVCAEEHTPPPEGATEWFHYDPKLASTATTLAAAPVVGAWKALADVASSDATRVARSEDERWSAGPLPA